MPHPPRRPAVPRTGLGADVSGTDSADRPRAPRPSTPDSPPPPGGTNPPGPTLLPLYTPAAAAELLTVRESWLRRKATARAVPCTFLGKHLRFSPADITAIAAAAAQPAHTSRPPRTVRRERRLG
ncbi:DNA-binding protein [Pseudonocardia sp. MH-G8]|uniref:DNA-binding protein n=1 Tax=Pseudonocardia sp. MH-G8 TaxID=1854588 RepID=UPI001E41C833|nr:DNA-binding protein [Pseudonocardia sp. MH-G8]